MSERKLTEEEISLLFEFCEFHNVRYYDVQIELVDHLASAIEQNWNKDLGLPFEDVLKAEYKGFGYGGFSAIVEKKEKALKEKYQSLQRKYVLQYFRLPKVILTMAGCLAIYSIFTFLPNYLLVVMCINLLFMMAVLSYLFIFSPTKYKMDLTPGKTFLLYDYLKSMRDRNIMVSCMPYSLIGIIIFLNFEFHFPFMDSFLLKIYCAAVFTFFSIVAFSVCFYIPRRIKEDFAREFPQFVKA